MCFVLEEGFYIYSNTESSAFVAFCAEDLLFCQLEASFLEL